MQSVPIPTKVVGTKPANGEVCSIQHYMIKFDRSVFFFFFIIIFFFAGISVPSSKKIDLRDITEKLLKMALSTMKPNQTNPFVFICKIFVPGKEKYKI